MQFKGFSFSLLPNKSKQEIKKETKRSNGLFYASILLFAIALLWLLIRGVDLIYVKNTKSKWQETSNSRSKEIATYSQYKIQNGELVTKTNILSEVVIKHLDPELVFGIIDKKIKESTPNVTIISYGRNPTGSFQVTGVTNNVNDVSKLLKNFYSEDGVEDVNLIRVVKTDNTYKFILDLKIKIDAAAATSN